MEYRILYKGINTDWRFDVDIFEDLDEIRLQKGEYIKMGYPEENVRIITIVE